MECWGRKKEKQKEKEKKWFLENGSIFLQQLIADCNGVSNPIRIFSSDQISKATDHFDPKFYLHDIPEAFTWYKAVIEGRSYAIKKFTDKWHQIHPVAPYNDTVLSSRVSNYSGFLQLMGCCLDFPCPVLVFENLEYRFLNVRGSVGCEDAPLLPWNVRLKIAKAVARAIAYLHTAFPRIIIHRNINPSNVLLDKNGMAKLTGFSKAVTLPEGKTWTEEEHVFGTYGYMDPIYLSTDRLTEYSDVFSFGILMLVLLVGKPAYWDESDGGILYPEILLLDYVKNLQERGEPIEFGGGSNQMRPGQMNMFLDLALRCCEERNEDRPKMISVAKEIKLIETMII
ncbi:unnamed protein product [Brassica oleracea]|uniref:Protein kinase domain-containing protein n=1 Tax=Brassica oleracea var. oleracea TaxID=109376 RepID=A0A0D3CUE6_BRAOL|nr:PREDICTED: non-functional pseudokinase ZED1-like [Brassica oleracea var. oleracea]